jgi:Uma2 family endonuclease
MILGGATRAADVAVWLRSDLPGTGHDLARVPPILAVEVAGRDDDEAHLRRKAAWYVGHGVATVWLVLPAAREVLVIRGDEASRHGRGQRLPAIPEMPGLSVSVDALFRQLDALG